MPDLTTLRDTDDLIEAMRLAGWHCLIELTPDPVPRGLSRYDVLFLRDPGRLDDSYSAGAPTLRKAVLKAAQRGCAALRPTQPARDEAEGEGEDGR